MSKLKYLTIDLGLFLALYAAIGHSLPLWRACAVGIVVTLFQQLGTGRSRRVWS